MMTIIIVPELTEQQRTAQAMERVLAGVPSNRGYSGKISDEIRQAKKNSYHARKTR